MLKILFGGTPDASVSIWDNMQNNIEEIDPDIFSLILFSIFIGILIIGAITYNVIRMLKNKHNKNEKNEDKEHE